MRAGQTRESEVAEERFAAAFDGDTGDQGEDGRDTEDGDRASRADATTGCLLPRFGAGVPAWVLLAVGRLTAVGPGRR